MVVKEKQSLSSTNFGKLQIGVGLVTYWRPLGSYGSAGIDNGKGGDDMWFDIENNYHKEVCKKNWGNSWRSARGLCV